MGKARQDLPDPANLPDPRTIPQPDRQAMVDAVLTRAYERTLASSVRSSAEIIQEMLSTLSPIPEAAVLGRTSWAFSALDINVESENFRFFPEGDNHDIG